MGAPDRTMTNRDLAAALLAGVLTLELAACSSTTEPLEKAAPLPPQTVVAPQTGAPPETPEREAPPTPPLPEPTVPEQGVPLDPARERSKTLIVIEAAEESVPAEDQDLAAAARRERERRRVADKPIAVIDQKNLATWAAGGVLTQATETADASSTAGRAAEEVLEKAAIDEAYWRKRGREIRQRWHDAHEQIAVLEAKSNELRNRFYATDDGFVRDSQVKPEWDKAIADLEEARYTASRGAEEVLAYLEEGRRAGALPGWLREGVELEPEPVLETASEPEATLEAKEPVIYRDPQAEPDPSEPPPGGAAAPASDRRR